MKEQRLPFKVHLSALFREIVAHTEVKGSPGAIMGLQIIMRSLHKIAERAIEIEDEIILTELEMMACITIVEGKGE